MTVRKTLPAVLALSLLGGAGALTLQGQLPGSVPPGLSVGVWSVSTSGQPQELVGVSPVKDGRWSIALTATPQRVPTLNADALAWPGLLPPAQLSRATAGQELRAYGFVDSNSNGRPDPNEPLRELRLRDQGQPLFLVWVRDATNVTASHGYQAKLSSGWNAFAVTLGSSVAVRPYSGQVVDSRLTP
ncbi:hypothetical protein [Deinococcus radiophilus]|uniref:Uncharacterized protein n=1 Tax=Deinococcus radiophilus TaxID=32062 RepID=A0A3S0RH60_9DEIO|nr:hypothetical protein [Deinococcus radiophilus]RTR28286.1 hypothetical protein EJ104_05055 [Deinococcus radiophilus]UFA51147.1 hypothetical protein LMT64_04410 [Deinococcus radiophilus]